MMNYGSMYNRMVERGELCILKIYCAQRVTHHSVARNFT